MMNFRRPATLLSTSTLLFVSAGFLLSCGPGRTAGWNKSAATDDGNTDAAAEASFLIQGDDSWNQRTSRENVEQAIAMWEKALAADGENLDLLTKLSRAYYLLADGYIASSDDTSKLLSTFDQGMRYAERGLVLSSPEIAKIVKETSKLHIRKVTQHVPNEGQATLYWWASNAGKFAVAKGIASTLYYKDDIYAAMSRVMEIDPNYYYAGPHRYFGAFYAKAPSFAGGDLNKSKEHFEKAIAMAPEYLGTKVLFASYYAVKKDDRALFEKLLDEVISADPTTPTEIVAEQSIEQNKAKNLKEDADELF